MENDYSNMPFWQLADTCISYRAKCVDDKRFCEKLDMIITEIDRRDAMLKIGEKPTKEEIREFVEIFGKLDKYETMEYAIRGYAVFDRNKEQLPNPACVKVLEWLKGLSYETVGRLE